MKNSIQFAAVIVSLMGLVTTASAKDEKRNSGGKKGKTQSNNSQQQQGQKQPALKVTKFTKDAIKKPVLKDQAYYTKDIKLNNQKHPNLKLTEKQSPTLRPFSADGRVMTADQPTITVVNPVGKNTPTPARPGYVWSNGAWVRAKADGSSVNTAGAPLNATVVVNDHKKPIPDTGRGQNVTPPPVGKNDSVKVTVSVPKELTGVPVYGDGLGLKEIIHVHNPKTIIDALPPWGFTAAEDPRDHRKPNDSRHGGK